MTHRFSILAASALLLALPVSTLAASEKAVTKEMPIEADEVTEEEILNAITPVESPMMDGRGGGGGMIYPGPGMGGVTVDASVTQEVTPDFIAINAYCDLGRKDTREELRELVAKLQQEIKVAVGKDGRVRRMGGASLYPFYDASGAITNSYSGSVTFFVRILNTKATQRISDYVEGKGCAVNWDVRLLDPQSYELKVLDNLVSRLNKRKAVFEKLLKKRLSRVVSASLNTWVDSYGTYDPEMNTAEATANLSVTFDLGGRAVIPPPMVQPKG